MIFRQRMPLSDLIAQTVAFIHAELLGALTVLANLWAERSSRLCAWIIDNSQILTGVIIGIFIGSSALALVTSDLIFTITFALPFWFASMSALSQLHGTQVQNVARLLAQQTSEQIDQQQEQPQTGQDKVLRITASIADDKGMTPLVEDALRHLYDCSYLGQHQLAKLQFLKRQQPCSGVSSLNNHIEVGRSLRSFLVDIIGQLRPTGQLPTGAVVPQREWHPYIILHASYVQGELTREIMARLYISEGNYNRTRRRAIYSVTRAILEIEQQTRSHTVGS